MQTAASPIGSCPPARRRKPTQTQSRELSNPSLNRCSKTFQPFKPFKPRGLERFERIELPLVRLVFARFQSVDFRFAVDLSPAAAHSFAVAARFPSFHVLAVGRRSARPLPGQANRQS